MTDKLLLHASWSLYVRRNTYWTISSIVLFDLWSQRTHCCCFSQV